MGKSLIEINRPETKRFGDYRQLADHLNEVKDSSEWTIVRAEDTAFDGESGANTFEAMGGDEFSCVSVSFDEGVTRIPLRYTALTSILNRCEVSGDGIKKLFLADKVYFAKDVGIFNGDVGYIKRIDTAEDEIVICFNGNNVTIDTTQLSDLDLAYAISIHKAQGSEYNQGYLSA